MPTDLDALAARGRQAKAGPRNDSSVILASLAVCRAVLILMSAFPTLAAAMAYLGQY